MDQILVDTDDLNALVCNGKTEFVDMIHLIAKLL